MQPASLHRNELLNDTLLLPGSLETGKLNIMHLKRYRAKHIAKKAGQLEHSDLQDEWMLDVSLLSAIGIGLQQVLVYIYNNEPDLDEFEDWVLSMNNGALPLDKINAFNAEITGTEKKDTEAIPNVLTAEDLQFWNENGYIIIRQAVSKEDCDKTIQLVCDHLGVSRNDPATWYDIHQDKQGIMVQLFQHHQLQLNRDRPVIRQTFQQLWGRTDIYVNTDRVGFNPPETDKYKFPGPRLHWDVSLELPIPFGLQGILYLADTAEDQGAFTLIPGFHNTIEQWIGSLPHDADPRRQDLYALGPKPIAANAGDFIIWHQALPHGSSPNNNVLPRFVQYINYLPIDAGVQKKWR